VAKLMPSVKLKELCKHWNRGAACGFESTYKHKHLPDIKRAVLDDQYYAEVYHDSKEGLIKAWASWLWSQTSLASLRFYSASDLDLQELIDGIIAMANRSKK